MVIKYLSDDIMRSSLPEIFKSILQYLSTNIMSIFGLQVVRLVMMIICGNPQVSESKDKTRFLCIPKAPAFIGGKFSAFPGLLRDRLGTYDVAFYLAGVPPLIGGAILCIIPWVHKRQKLKERAKTVDGETTEKMLENESTLVSDAAEKPVKEMESGF